MLSTATQIPTDRSEFRTTASAQTAAVQGAVATDIKGNPGGGAAALCCFGLTLFASATLLFLIQPMIGKMILPLLGGTPAVWNACMLFFQAALLAGYAYAHVTTSWLGTKRQALVHLGVVLLPLLVLPVAISRGGSPPADANPIPWLLSCLALSVGLPFFVVSTTGPLLQRWFADTGHPSARDPFFLYAASNAGSLLALIGYPFLLEPAMALAEQSRTWAWGYALFVFLIGVCAIVLWISRGTQIAATPEQTDSQPQTRSRQVVDLPYQTQPVTIGRRAWWVLAAFVPSSLMLGVTAHVTTNLAPVPLLWVLPLAIYLLTFVLVFARSRPIPQAWMVRTLPFLLPPLAVLTFLDLPSMAWVAVLVHLGSFFVATMVCHGELADRRPSASHLTEFYLWMSVGGVLGGVFNAIVAPVLFDTIAEYPLAIVLVCLLLPRSRSYDPSRSAFRSDFVGPVILGAIAAGVLIILRVGGWNESLGMRFVVFGPLALLCFSFKDRPIRFTLGLGVFMVAVAGYCGLHRGSELYATRNFFGVKRVAVDSEGVFRVLIHGNTTHGKQFIDPSRSGEPLTYYHREGPLGDIFSEFSGETKKAHIAAIGLGTGSIAAYAEPSQSMTIYEIDPEVEQIARDPRYFSFLEQCQGECDVVLGDGRRMLEQEPDGRFGMILLDAFSSDSIPTHLLTREALELYMSKLEDDGILAFHISNRYLRLEPLMASLAADAGLYSLIRSDRRLTQEDKDNGMTPAVYVVMSRTPGDAGGLTGKEGWEILADDSGAPVWTDQYTSLLSFVHWQ